MRLIDADAYATELWKMRQNYQLLDDTQTADKIMHGLYRAEQALKDAPTIDAVPVRRGEWSNRRTWTHDGEWYCTACDKEITIYMGEKRGNDRYKYCPNCGAIMDGEQDV